MQATVRYLALILVCATASGSNADTLVIPIGSEQERAQAGPLPQLGMSRSQVRAQWGEPRREHAAVGNPPIQRWEYPAFDVYFEHDHVLHAVVPHRPPPPLIIEQPPE